MEKENYRVNVANCNPIKNQNERAEPRESGEKRWTQEEKYFRNLEKNRKVDDEVSSTPRNTAMFGLCAVCHLTLGTINSDLDQHLPCSKGHALCQRCMEHFVNQSEPGCVLCHAQLRGSNVSLSRDSDASLNSIYVRSKRTQEFPRQHSQYYPNDHQGIQQCIPINIEQSCIKPWTQNYSTTVPNTEKNVSECYNTDDFEEDSDYERNRDQIRSENDETRNDTKQGQQYSYCDLFKKANSYMFDVKVNGQISSECSRRPIRCPRIDCAINVAFSALTHHFIFDHPEVPILNVEPGIKSTLIVSFNALSSGSSRCLALLLVSGKLSDPVARLFNGSQINPKFRNRLPLPVLAARLQCTDQYVSTDKVNNKKELREKDVIIAWVAGLDIGNTTDKLLCSIQAMDKIDNEGLRSLTYTGPVNSLRTAQCPRDIFLAGDCIILHEGLLSHITSDCATLNVNVTVH